MSDKNLDASIIIPVKEDVRIVRCLKALFSQETQYVFEVIVIENDIEPKLKKLILEFNVKYYFENRISPYIARNIGIANAKGSILLFTDATCVPKSDWVENMLNSFKKNLKAGGIVGKISKINSESKISNAQRDFQMYNELQYIPPLNNLPYGAAGNVAYSKRILEELCGFDETFISGGDVDMSWRVQLAGYTLKYAPDAVVFFEGRNSFKGYFKQYYKYGSGHVYLFKKHNDLSGKKILFDIYPYKGFAISLIKIIFFSFLWLFKRNSESKILLHILNILEYSGLIFSRIIFSIKYKIIFL